MEEEFHAEKSCLFALLREALTGEDGLQEGLQPLTAVNWEELAGIAQRHSVLSLLYDVVSEGEYPIPEKIKRRTAEEARQAVLQSYHLLFFGRYLIEKLENAGVAVALLKGVGTAALYPVPELRRARDVDLLLLAPEQLETAIGILKQSGCAVREKQSALHHVELISEEGIGIDLHTMLAKPFDNEKINRYLKEKLGECREHVMRAEVMGTKLPVLEFPYYAYQLLIHMLKDFLGPGFGLKLLCDWTMLWSRDRKEQEKGSYLKFVEDSGLKGFSDMVTAACCRYLGLRREQVEWMGLEVRMDAVESFMADVLEAEELSSDRMVALRGDGIAEYIREFHHQMKLNFPRGGRCVLCWPVLWAATLVRFLRNNRRIRKISAGAILKKAGQRGRLIADMKLWKQQ